VLAEVAHVSQLLVISRRACSAGRRPGLSGVQRSPFSS
jgi:hypothetical protein